MRRIRRARMSIAQILAGRVSRFPRQSAETGRRAELFGALCKCINCVCRWETESFIDADRMSSLLLGFDALDVAEFEQSVMEEIGVCLHDHISLDRLYDEMTLGEVTDLLCRICPSTNAAT